MSKPHEHAGGERHHCALCPPGEHRGGLVPFAAIHEPVLDLVRADHPDLPAEGFLCHRHLDHYRDLYVRRAIEADKGQLDELEKEVLRSLEENDILAENAEEVFEGTRTVGERLSDVIADFGGSWRFILFFGAVLFGWIGLNLAGLFADPFDPYPFILLNLVLSCLAAIQAPKNSTTC